jgi:hypothetical protein
LDEDVERLLDQQGRVEDDQPEAERQHIIAGADLEEGANRSLLNGQLVSNACRSAGENHDIPGLPSALGLWGSTA